MEQTKAIPEADRQILQTKIIKWIKSDEKKDDSEKEKQMKETYISEFLNLLELEYFDWTTENEKEQKEKWIAAFLNNDDKRLYKVGYGLKLSSKERFLTVGIVYIPNNNRDSPVLKTFRYPYVYYPKSGTFKLYNDHDKQFYSLDDLLQNYLIKDVRENGMYFKTVNGKKTVAFVPLNVNKFDQDVRKQINRDRQLVKRGLLGAQVNMEENDLYTDICELLEYEITDEQLKQLTDMLEIESKQPNESYEELCQRIKKSVK